MRYKIRFGGAKSLRDGSILQALMHLNYHRTLKKQTKTQRAWGLAARYKKRQISQCFLMKN